MRADFSKIEIIHPHYGITKDIRVLKHMINNKILDRRQLLKVATYSLAGASLSPLLVGSSAAAATEGKRPSAPGIDPTKAQMLRHLRAANKVAKVAMDAGHHPFGVVLVAADNETVLMEQGNVDSVGHAESTLAQRASKKFSPQQLWGMTLYSTAEPCVMCAGTQYWANIGRLVYGMSERQLLDFTGNNSENPTLDIPSRYVFEHSQKAIKVWGPIEDAVAEIAALHVAFWK